MQQLNRISYADHANVCSVAYEKCGQTMLQDISVTMRMTLLDQHDQSDGYLVSVLCKENSSQRCVNTSRHSTLPTCTCKLCDTSSAPIVPCCESVLRGTCPRATLNSSRPVGGCQYCQSTSITIFCCHPGADGQSVRRVWPPLHYTPCHLNGSQQLRSYSLSE